MISTTEIFTDTAVLGMIEHMPELDEMITTREAWEIAKKMGEKLSHDSITQAARNGNIENARKLWDNIKAPWIFPHESFLFWLENRRSPGRPKKENEA